MVTQIIDMGIISAIFKYEIDGDVAVIHELRLGGADSVKYPLDDKWDADNFSKMLADKIGMDVVAAEVETPFWEATA